MTPASGRENNGGAGRGWERGRARRVPFEGRTDALLPTLKFSSSRFLYLKFQLLSSLVVLNSSLISSPVVLSSSPARRGGLSLRKGLSLPESHAPGSLLRCRRRGGSPCLKPHHIVSLAQGWFFSFPTPPHLCLRHAAVLSVRSFPAASSRGRIYRFRSRPSLRPLHSFYPSWVFQLYYVCSFLFLLYCCLSLPT